MRIATWNLWWRFGPWQARQDPIADELLEVDPDVACLQEVWAERSDASDVDTHGTDDLDAPAADQACILADRLGRHVVRSTGSDGRPLAFGNAILSRWPLHDARTVRLPGPDGRPGHRSAVIARVEVPESRYEWWVASTHLEWRYDASPVRQEQLAVVVGALAAVVDDPTQAVVVIGADLNAVPDSDEVRRLTGLSTAYPGGLVFTDAWAAVGDGDGVTWTRDNPHSVDAQWPRRRVDHVMVGWPRPKPTGNPVAADLFGTDDRPSPDGPMVPSDHYGVVVELDRREP